MKLVEVVVLLGTHCVSPLETAPNVTVVGKVPCAVLIHQDTDDNRIQIVPAGEAANPAVRAALARVTGEPPSAQAIGADAGAPLDFGPADPSPPAVAAKPDPAVDRPGVVPAEPPANPTSRVVVEWPPKAEADVTEAPPPAAETVVAEAAAEPEPETALPAPEAEPPSVAEAEPSAEPPADVPPPKKAVSKTAASKKARRTAAVNPAIARQTNSLKTVCRYPRVAQWYKNKSGRLKYRCVASAKQGVY